MNTNSDNVVLADQGVPAHAIVHSFQYMVKTHAAAKNIIELMGPREPRMLQTAYGNTNNLKGNIKNVLLMQIK